MTEEPTVSHLNGVLMRARGKGNTVGLSQCMNVQNGGRQVWVSWFQMWSGSISTKASFFLMKENYGNFFIPDLSHVNPHTSARAHTHTHTHTHTPPPPTYTYTYRVPFPLSRMHPPSYASRWEHSPHLHQGWSVDWPLYCSESVKTWDYAEETGSLRVSSLKNSWYKVTNWSEVHVPNTLYR